MPATLTYPGVYIQKLPSGVRTLIGVATTPLEPDTAYEIVARIWKKRLLKTTLVMPVLFPGLSAGAIQTILTMPCANINPQPPLSCASNHNSRMVTKSSRSAA